MSMIDRGKLVVDPFALSGIDPAKASPAEVRRAIQDPINAMPGPDNAPGRALKLVLPSSPDPIRWDRPILLSRSRVTIEGEGDDFTRCICMSGHDALVAGLALSPGGKPPDPGHWVPNWIVPGKVAFCTMGTSQLYGNRCAFDVGPPGGWGSIDGLTIDLAIDLSNVGPTDIVMLCGMRDGGQTPAPAYLWVGYGNLVLSVMGGDGRPRTYSAIGVPLRKVQLAVQFVAGVPLFAFDGVVAPGRQGGNLLPWAAGMKFANPDPCPFKVGAGGQLATDRTEGGSGDFAVAGLRWSAGPVYKPASSGQPLARLDGKPITPEATYFTPDKTLIGLLPLAAAPSDPVVEATAWMTAWPFPSTLYQIDAAHANSPMSRIAVRNLSIGHGYATRTGRALAVGLLMGGDGPGLDARGCRLVGNSNGVGSLAMGANYPINFRDCTFGIGNGGDSPVHLISSTAYLDGCNVAAGNPRAIVRAWAGNMTVNRMFAICGGNPEYGIQAAGAKLEVNGFGTDEEGFGEGTSHALIFCSPGDDPTSGSCRINGIGESMVGPDEVMVELGPGIGRASHAKLENLSSMIGSRTKPRISASANWTVELGGDLSPADVSGVGKVLGPFIAAPASAAAAPAPGVAAR